MNNIYGNSDLPSEGLRRRRRRRHLVLGRLLEWIALARTRLATGKGIRDTGEIND